MRTGCGDRLPTVSQTPTSTRTVGDKTGEVGWVLFLRGLECQARWFVFIAGGDGESLKTVEQEGGSIEDSECQENPPGPGGLSAEN